MIILTEEEKRTKKGWLFLLLFGLLLSAAAIFGVVGPQKTPPPPIFSLIGLGFGAAFAYLYYSLCYRRATTFLLTFSLISFWASLLTNAILLFKGVLPIDLFIGLSLITGALNYIFTLRLRRLNKALKGYAKFPEESKEAAASFQSATSQAEVRGVYSEGVKKWPHLKWVLKRERTIKAKTVI